MYSLTSSPVKRSGSRFPEGPGDPAARAGCGVPARGGPPVRARGPEAVPELGCAETGLGTSQSGEERQGSALQFTQRGTSFKTTQFLVSQNMHL